jgi:hypothetical protein
MTARYEIRKSYLTIKADCTRQKKSVEEIFMASRSQAVVEVGYKDRYREVKEQI